MSPSLFHSCGLGTHRVTFILASFECDPKSCDWGRCYCAAKIEWPLSCTDSKGNNDCRRPFPLVLESVEWHRLEPNRSDWTGSPSELIVSIDPLSSLQQAPNSPPQSQVPSTVHWWALSRWWAPNQYCVCSAHWRLVLGENLWASVTMCRLMKWPHSLLKIASQHECRKSKKNVEKLKQCASSVVS